MSHGGKLSISVAYPTTNDELKDHHAARDETLGSLKTRVLAAFSLKEGINDHGQLVEFAFIKGDRRLQDLSRTVGQTAGDADELSLRLDRERHFFFYIERRIVSPVEKATGLQIKTMIKEADPTFDMGHTLILEGHGNHPDKIIADDDEVSLEVDATHPAKHVFSKPPTNFGSF